MKAEEKHQVSEWLKKQKSELKINPSHYFDLIDLIYNYHKEQLSTNEDKVSVLCECGGNERVALDCTMKPCKHPKYLN